MLSYESFCEDFGPLNLSMTYKFCYQLSEILKDPKFLDQKIYHYTSLDPAKRANAGYLMGAFQVIILNRSARDA